MLPIFILFWVLGLIGISIPMFLLGSGMNTKEKVKTLLMMQTVYTMAELAVIIFVNYM